MREGKKGGEKRKGEQKEKRGKGQKEERECIWKRGTRNSLEKKRFNERFLYPSSW